MTQVNAQSFIPTVPNPSKFNTLEDVINTAGTVVRPVIVISMIGISMYGGYVRLMAKDNADQIAKSYKIIIGALVGFVIIVLAPVITDLAGSLLGVSGGLVDLTN